MDAMPVEFGKRLVERLIGRGYLKALGADSAALDKKTGIIAFSVPLRTPKDDLAEGMVWTIMVGMDGPWFRMEFRRLPSGIIGSGTPLSEISDLHDETIVAMGGKDISDELNPNDPKADEIFTNEKPTSDTLVVMSFSNIRGIFRMIGMATMFRTIPDLLRHVHHKHRLNREIAELTA